MKLFLRLTVFGLSFSASISFLTEWFSTPVLSADLPVDASWCVEDAVSVVA
jgi:hypothetical protein